MKKQVLLLIGLVLLGSVLLAQEQLFNDDYLMNLNDHINEYKIDVNDILIDDYSSTKESNQGLNWLQDSMKRYDWEYYNHEWEIDINFYYTYDERGRLIEELWCNNWEPNDKTEYKYNENDQLVERKYSIWNSSIDEFRVAEKRVYTYLENKIIEFIKYEGNANAPKYRIKYNYDFNGNMIEEISYIRDWMIEEWVSYTKKTYSYDDGNIMKYEACYNWNTETGEWTPDMLNEYYYNETGKLSELIYFTFNSEINNWINQLKYEYSYSSINNLIAQEYILSWHREQEIWIPYRAYIYTYNLNGQLTEYLYNDLLYTEANNFKYSYNYDINNKLIEMISYDWETNVNDWVENRKQEYNYDINGNKSETIHFIYGNGSNQWANDYKFYHFWSYYYFFSENENICEGETFVWRGLEIDTAGIFYKKYQDINGFDSIFELNLIVNPVYSYTEEYSICEGESYTWYGTEYFTGGIYSSEYQSIHGCDSIFELNLSVREKPIAGFIFESNEAEVIFTNTSVNASSYLWEFGDGNSDTIINPVHTYVLSGEYLVTLTAYSDLCGDTTEIQSINVATRINTIEFGDIANIYPNPSTGKFKIELSSRFKNTVFVQIIDIGGNIIYSNFDIEKSNKEIDLSNFSKGMYLLKIQGEDFTKTEKLIIE